MTAVAWPSRMSTVSSTLCVWSGIWVPGANVVMPVVTVLPSAFHLPTNGSVETPVPRSKGSISDDRITMGALTSAAMGVYVTCHARGSPAEPGPGADRRLRADTRRAGGHPDRGSHGRPNVAGQD